MYFFLVGVDMVRSHFKNSEVVRLNSTCTTAWLLNGQGTQLRMAFCSGVLYKHTYLSVCFLWGVFSLGSTSADQAEFQLDGNGNTRPYKGGSVRPRDTQIA